MDRVPQASDPATTRKEQGTYEYAARHRHQDSRPSVTPATTFRGKTLYAFQQRAMAAISEGRSVIVAAPTGAGKTLVADYAIEEVFAAGRRIIYTAPVKALSN